MCPNRSVVQRGGEFSLHIACGALEPVIPDINEFPGLRGHGGAVSVEGFSATPAGSRSCC